MQTRAPAPVTPPPANRPATPPPALAFPELQGQRGLAALLVVVFHAYQSHRLPPDGRYQYAGRPVDTVITSLDGMVDWFFVLSAFLLTLPYARAVLAGRRPTAAKDFLGRRAVRIVPLYLIAVTTVWATRNPSLPGDWRDLLEHLTFTNVYDRTRIFYTVGPAWSLAVEVQFYVVLVVLGTLLGALGQRTASRRSRLGMLLAVPAGLLTVSVAWTVAFSSRPANHWEVWFGLPPKLGVFAAGTAAAVLVALRRSPVPPAAVWALRLAGLAVVVVGSVTRVSTTGPGETAFHLLCGLGFAGVVLAGAWDAPRGPWHRVFGVGVLPWLGLVSYSLYLWHEPILLSLSRHGLVPGTLEPGFLATTALLVPVSLLAAWASWWAIEYPFSNLRFFLGDLPSRELQAERRSAL
ncbi:MAG: acyltransferase 3 [Frankiales bacterium]|nr:acyltransferase 3 [Frankiales bacterium]